MSALSGMTAQDLIVALVAAVALGWLLWRRFRPRPAGAPACENCPHANASARPSTAPEPVMLIQIGSPSEPARRTGE
jgi:hypothetical protein